MNADAFGNLCHRYSAGAQRPHVFHDRLRELEPSSALRVHVGQVFGATTKKKMRRVNAYAIVAAVTDAGAARDGFAAMKREGEPVSTGHSPIDSQPAVPVSVQVPLPDPASIAYDEHVSPETVDRRRRPPHGRQCIAASLLHIMGLAQPSGFNSTLAPGERATHENT